MENKSRAWKRCLTVTLLWRNYTLQAKHSPLIVLSPQEIFQRKTNEPNPGHVDLQPLCVWEALLLGDLWSNRECYRLLRWWAGCANRVTSCICLDFPLNIKSLSSGALEKKSPETYVQSEIKGCLISVSFCHLLIGLLLSPMIRVCKILNCFKCCSDAWKPLFASLQPVK